MNVQQDGILFQPAAIGARVAPNRLVANPVERNMGGDDGGPSEEAISTYEELARGRWGVVFVESTAATAQMRYRGPGAHALILDRNTVGSFERLVERFKSANAEALLMIQLSPGAFGLDADAACLSYEDIETASAELREAILLAERAGFDGVDFKQCHGSLASRLIGKTNTRADEWGGTTVAEKAAFVTRTAVPVRRELADAGKNGFLIGTRVSELDLAYLRLMVGMYETQTPFDFINVSSSPLTNNAHALFALSQAVKLMGTTRPVIASGGTDAIFHTQSFQRVRDLMEGDLAPEFIGFGMQSLADPLMPAKLMDGRTDEIKWCNKCEGCVGLFSKAKAVVCVRHGAG
jgi:2,4-dienoyl-CoA reductase-like NADH-dependent reductase (Old Yellow Enzyme family)